MERSVPRIKKINEKGNEVKNAPEESLQMPRMHNTHMMTVLGDVVGGKKVSSVHPGAQAHLLTVGELSPFGYHDIESHALIHIQHRLRRCARIRYGLDPLPTKTRTAVTAAGGSPLEPHGAALDLDELLGDGKPEPVPPNFRLWDESSWEKDLKAGGCDRILIAVCQRQRRQRIGNRHIGIRAVVAQRQKGDQGGVGRRCTARRRPTLTTTTPPTLVNMNAFPRALTTIRMSHRESPRRWSGTVGSTVQINGAQLVDHAAQAEGAMKTVKLGHSTLYASGDTENSPAVYFMV
ncbi:hypothetical protein BC938DRAFT_475868 [Jimgerdemannia flammicorona]|uniref:Uncharacterized protein n=1 Tax=Jimgerdemannia flammicorona TaxID=994334 RepID=A0A433QR65_9FUNG|nr:hypothetical protein BC938DRAFT_475868 [Jimgerdemannia flammicorona]